MTSYRHNAGSDVASRATLALLDFCVRYERSGYTELLEACDAALRVDGWKAAIRAFEQVPFGGNGTFSDWWPSSELPERDRQIAGATYEVLTNRWVDLMTSAGAQPNRLVGGA